MISQLHEAYRPVLGAVAWIELSRAELAVYVQALQRRSHAPPRIIDCKRLNVAIRFALQRPLELVASTDAAFKAQPDEASGLVLRGLAATLCENRGEGKQPHGDNKKANLVDFIVMKQGRVFRSTCSAELNGFVDSVEQMLSFQCALQHILWSSKRPGVYDRSA